MNNREARESLWFAVSYRSQYLQLWITERKEYKALYWRLESGEERINQEPKAKQIRQETKALTARYIQDSGCGGDMYRQAL